MTDPKEIKEFIQHIKSPGFTKKLKTLEKALNNLEGTIKKIEADRMDWFIDKFNNDPGKTEKIKLLQREIEKAYETPYTEENNKKIDILNNQMEEFEKEARLNP